MAGVSRIQYPPYLRVIRVMCSGRIDPVFIFRAFKSKADGVLVVVHGQDRIKKNGSTMVSGRQNP